MKVININKLLLLMGVALCSTAFMACSDDDEQAVDYQKISLRSDASSGNDASTSTSLISTRDLNTFTAYAYSVDPVDQDVTIEVAKADTLVNGDEGAELLPEGSYTLTTTTTVIRKGQRVSETPIQLQITDVTQLVNKLYELPVYIKSISGLDQSRISTANTVVFKVYVDLPGNWKRINTSNWTATQTGAYQGSAAQLIDGSDNTGWIPAASNDGVTFTFDEPTEIKGLCIIDQNRYTGWGYSYSPTYLWISGVKEDGTDADLNGGNWTVLNVPTDASSELQYVTLDSSVGKLSSITIYAYYAYRGFAEIYFYN